MNSPIHFYNYRTPEGLGTLDKLREHELNKVPPVYYYFKEFADSDSRNAIFMVERESLPQSTHHGKIYRTGDY